MTNTLHISFTGEYYNFLDTKNRLNIPAKFRKVLDPINDRTFVITRGFDQCLVLYPLYNWSQVEEQLSTLSSIRGNHRNFVRSITRFAISVQYDAQGRIPIPDTLLSYSSIQKEAVVIGMINKIELWDPSILSQLDSKLENVSDKGFDDLADEINFNGERKYFENSTTFGLNSSWSYT